MADKESLRKLFGKDGDFNQNLADMFGNSYTDGPDDTKVDVTPEMEDAGLLNIRGILDRKYESLPKINCEDHKNILRKFLRGENCTFDEITSTTLHSEYCHDEICQRLNQIACLDQFYPLEDLANLARQEGLL